MKRDKNKKRQNSIVTDQLPLVFTAEPKENIPQKSTCNVLQIVNRRKRKNDEILNMFLNHAKNLHW